MNRNSFLANISYALIAQAISLFSSFVIQFFAPKLLGVAEFGYWQLFLFYVSYINISRLGIIDGIYLKNGGKTREELDLKLLKTDFSLFMILQIVVSLTIAAFAVLSISDSNRLYVIIACLVCMVVINYNNFLGFLFQAINETKWYSLSEAIYNTFWFIGIAILYGTKSSSFHVLVIFYVIGQIVAGIYLSFKARFLLAVKPCEYKKALIDLIDDAKIGVFLLFAMYASMLIVGSARFVVDGRWGIEAFSYFSFSLSISTFLLKFISQISMVMFPALRLVDDSRKKIVFYSLDDIISGLIPAGLLLYVPVSVLVAWWVPEYSSSLYYLIFLLPICVFDGKMQLVYSTYFKVIRKEKYLLLVNIVATVVSLICSIVSAYVLNNMTCIAISLLISILVRSLVSEFLLCRLMKSIPNYKMIISELVLSTAFILINLRFSGITAFLSFFASYLVFVALNLHNIRFGLFSIINH